MPLPFRLDSSFASALAEQFGTPLYVLSEAAMVERIREFRSALDKLDAGRPGNSRSRMSYASKANSTLAVLQIAHREGCHIDVASEGELRAALKAGIPARDCTFHGNNKSVPEITFALRQGIAEIVVDSADEVGRYGNLEAPYTRFVLRVNPMLELGLNPKVATASSFSKFGFPSDPATVEENIRKLAHFGYEGSGLHCHLGSQILRPDAHARAAEILVSLMNGVPAQWTLLNLGGGFGVRYTDEEPPTFAQCLREVSKVDIPKNLTIAFEPGRSMVGDAGITLYTVGTIKQVAGTRIVAVDGGLADNPRPVMYDARYQVEAFREGDDAPATIVGRHCENDVLHPDVALPGNLKPGDLVQVLCTGAYSSSMASNYNRYPRPATVLIRVDGRAQLVQQRENYDQMLAREVLIDE